MARDCPNRGMRDDSGINLKRAFGCFVGMTREVSSLFFFKAGYHDDSTTGSRARLRIHYVSHTRCIFFLKTIRISAMHVLRTIVAKAEETHGLRINFVLCFSTFIFYNKLKIFCFHWKQGR